MEDIEKEFDNIINGNGKDEKSKTEKNKKKIPIKKYSHNGNGPLHESVVMGEKPTFVYLDKDNKPKFMDQIERANDILVPGDTIDTQNPIPFIFDSKQELEQCLEEAINETLDSLFLKLESINRKYVDVEDHYHVIFTANMLWTWLQDQFGYTHYIVIVGDNGSGKNSQLLVFKFLGYRVFYIVSASAPNYYTKLGNVEEGQCCIAEDEAEDIAFNREKRNVFKTGYCSGASIPKVELEGGRKSEDWLTYCQKWVAMEELPNDKQLKGVLDRSFVFKFLAGDPQYNIKDVLRFARDPKFKPLYDELIKTRKILFCWRLLHYNDILLDVQLNVKNRSAELTKPLIKLFQNSPIALERILDALSKFMVERSESKKNSFESKLFEAITELITERKERFEIGRQTDEDGALDESTFTNQAIREKCVKVMDAEETPDKVGSYYSPDVGSFSQSKITRVLKSKFKADPLSKKIDDKTKRCIKFEQKYLDRIKLNYDIPDKIDIIKKREQVTEVTEVTEITEVRGILPLYDAIMNAKITANSQNLFENSNKNNQFIVNQIEGADPKDGPTLEKSVISVTSVTGLARAPDESDPLYNCYVCIKRKKKRFRTNDLAKYRTHWISSGHKGPCLPNLVDVEYHGWEPQNKPWET